MSLVNLQDLIPILTNKTLKATYSITKAGIKSFKITNICVSVKLYSYYPSAIVVALYWYLIAISCFRTFYCSNDRVVHEFILTLLTYYLFLCFLLWRSIPTSIFKFKFFVMLFFWFFIAQNAWATCNSKSNYDWLPNSIPWLWLALDDNSLSKTQG